MLPSRQRDEALQCQGMFLQPCTIRSPAFGAVSQLPVRNIVQPVPHFRRAKALR